MEKKGFIIKQEGEDLDLSIKIDDFTSWINSLPKTDNGWVYLRIHKRTDNNSRGYTHNIDNAFNRKRRGNGI